MQERYPGGVRSRPLLVERKTKAEPAEVPVFRRPAVI